MRSVLINSNVYQEDGKFVHTRCFSRDVTDQVRLEEEKQTYTRQLEAQNRELEDFNYIVSHDLKEPLRAIATYASYLQENVAKKCHEQDQEIIQKMQDLSIYLMNLLDKLRQYAALSQKNLRCQDVAIGDIAQRVIDSLQMYIEEHNAQVIVGELPRAWVDESMIGEVFRNLLMNGIKYNRSETPTMEIGVIPCDDPHHHVIFVQDNGIGIDPKYHQKVFKLFQRLHPRDAFGGGDGYGLTLAKRILEKTGDRIWLDSDSQHGTTFYFTMQRGKP